jgi:7,8-dihydropterin-6-yl-methyl-4-(beta-D-ribofuranosyl)aminobenzene 5'-phosphate synthase
MNTPISQTVLLFIASALSFVSLPLQAQEAQTFVQDEDITVTVLTTNTADFGAFDGITQGEWSFAAWVEVGERAFLFATGWSPDNVLNNAAAMGIDLSVAEDVVLSHNHIDHTGGLETLRRALSKRNPKALSRIHVASGIFASRPGQDGEELNPMVALRQRLSALGSTFFVYEEPTEIAPGVWVTGPVPRVHEERNYDRGPEAIVVLDGVLVPDVIPESQSLIITGAGGPVMVSGCGHAGLINSLEYAHEAISPLPPQAAIGGYHLFGASYETLSWTSGQLADMQLKHFVGSHCTGFESVYTIRELMGIGKDQAIVGTIGTRYEGGSGIVPGDLNR